MEIGIRRTKNREPRTENQEQRTENREPTTENQEPTTENREPRTKNRELVRMNLSAKTVGKTNCIFVKPEEWSVIL
jgi:biotin carboxyl carrier protein